jgi:Mn-dependent DtxR family transcriptional regulator
MAIIERTVRVLEELSKRTEPAKPLEIAQALQLEPIHVGKELVELAKAGYAVKKDKDKNTWAITDEGTA